MANFTITVPDAVVNRIRVAVSENPNAPATAAQINEVVLKLFKQLVRNYEANQVSQQITQENW